MGPETILTEPALSRDPKCPDPPTSSSSEHEFEFDAASEKRLVRKLDQRLVLVAFLCYLTAMLDRSNIGNAETAGMSEDLGMSDAQYQWLLTIFYIPYILFEWLALMWKIFPPHIWASAVSSIRTTLVTPQATRPFSCELNFGSSHVPQTFLQSPVMTDPETCSASSPGR